MDILVDVDSFRNDRQYAELEELVEKYNKGQYKDVVIYIDAMYGWGEDELGRNYTQEEAKRCLKVLGGNCVK